MVLEDIEPSWWISEYTTLAQASENLLNRIGHTVKYPRPCSITAQASTNVSMAVRVTGGVGAARSSQLFKKVDSSAVNGLLPLSHRVTLLISCSCGCGRSICRKHASSNVSSTNSVRITKVRNKQQTILQQLGLQLGQQRESFSILIFPSRVQKECIRFLAIKRIQPLLQFADNVLLMQQHPHMQLPKSFE